MSSRDDASAEARSPEDARSPDPGSASHTLTGAIDVPGPGGEARFTSRSGGVSDGPYALLNLGPWTDDASDAVSTNHAIVERSVGPGYSLRIARQVHEATVAVHLADGPDPSLDGVDAQVTDRRDLILAALTADCLPVALLAPWGVGVAHAGWRGLAAGVVTRTIEALLGLPGAGRVSEIAAITGPCAAGCCYEVGPEVHAAFAGHPGGHLAKHRTGPEKIDLPAIAAAELQAAGVHSVSSAGGCTIHDDQWFSHRRSGGITGRQAGLVWRT